MLKGIHKARVENNIDPNNEQRIQIRVLALHNFDEKEAPKECLPWALPVLPPSDGKIDGGYGVFDVPDLGDWVWVFFEDEYMFNPHYFGTIRTEKDTNPKYKQGINKFIKDRWDNEVLIDKEKILITKNNGHIIELHDDFIKIQTKSNQIIKIDEVDKSIMIQDVNENLIRTDSTGVTVLRNNNEYTRIVENSIISATDEEDGTPRDDIAVLGRMFMELFNTHTHIGNLGVATSVPTIPMTEEQHLKSSIVYTTKADTPVDLLTGDDETDKENAKNKTTSTPLPKSISSHKAPKTDDSSLTEAVTIKEEAIAADAKSTAETQAAAASDVYLACHSITSKSEGGYNPHDWQLPSYGGVTQSGFPTWVGWNIIKQYEAFIKRSMKPYEFVSAQVNPDLAAQMLEALSSFYKTYFWIPVKGDDLAIISPVLALQVFDMGINAGTSRAISILKSSIGATTSAGIKELMTKNNWTTMQVIQKYMDGRKAFYAELGARPGKKGDYPMKSWVKPWQSRVNATTNAGIKKFGEIK